MPATGAQRQRLSGIHRRSAASTTPHRTACALRPQERRCTCCEAYQSGAYHGGITEMTWKQRKRLEEAFERAGSKSQLPVRVLLKHQAYTMRNLLHGYVRHRNRRNLLSFRPSCAHQCNALRMTVPEPAADAGRCGRVGNLCSQCPHRDTLQSFCCASPLPTK